MRRFTFSLALACAFAVFPALTASADDPFTVSGVHVDASAASASTAQLAAIAQGRPKAWATLYRRVVGQKDWGKQPKLDDTALQRIIRSFTVKNEKRSTTRYVGDVTYVFSPESVQRALSGVAVVLTAAAPKRILLVPFAPNYSRSSMWTSSFAGTRYASAAVPFAVPAGETFEGVSFDTANWTDVEPAAMRIHASEAALVQATPNGKTMTVTVRRLGSAELPSKTSIEVPMLPGGAAGTYSSAADAAVKTIEEMWKSQPANSGPAGRLTADVRIASLAQWTSLQAQMATVPNVSGVSVQAMDIGEVRITLAYLGTTDQLRDALGAQGISLVKTGGEWSLSGTGTP